jgi:hypothetical protein
MSQKYKKGGGEGEAKAEEAVKANFQLINEEWIHIRSIA